MNYIKEERELNLKELFFDVCSKWRSILVVCFLVAIVVIGINAPMFMEYKEIYGLMPVSKVLLLHVIVVCFISMVVLVVFYAFRYMFSDTIKSMVDYNLSCNINLIGVIPSDSKKKTFILDKLIRKLQGIKIYKRDRDSLIERIANIVNVEASKSKEKVTIAVVSSNTDNDAVELVNLVSEKCSKESVDVIAAGNIMTSSNGVKIVSNADYVIMVERRYKSKYSEIEQTGKQISLLGKSVLGIVILDIEAI